MDVDPKESQVAEHSEIEEATNKPSPANLAEFLPWACKQLMFNFEVQIQKNTLVPYISQVKRDDKRKSRKSITSGKSFGKVSGKLGMAKSEMSHKSQMALDQVPDVDVDDTEPDDSMIKLNAIYNVMDQLVEIKFLHNAVIPCELLNLLGQIVYFYPLLHSITITRGINSKVVYEIYKFLPSSFITDICLDGCFIKDANYHVLLDCKNLKYLSLSRCKINDDFTDVLASQLTSDYKAGLVALNLSSNFIADDGAISLAKMLRSNRTLAYLNLAGNQITDVGASSILDVLNKFRMSSSEITLGKRAKFAYLFEKSEVVNEILLELQKVQEKPVKKKPAPVNRNKLKSEEGDLTNEAKAEELAIRQMGAFTHPFSKENTVTEDDVMYCKGNNTLNYLNLAYNSLSNLILKKLFNVLLMQACYEREPRGLVNVCLDGNPMPVSCVDLENINELLRSGLQADAKKYGVNTSKASARRQSSVRW